MIYYKYKQSPPRKKKKTRYYLHQSIQLNRPKTRASINPGRTKFHQTSYRANHQFQPKERKKKP